MLRSLLALIVLGLAASNFAATELYVSPSGSDTNNGLSPDNQGNNVGPFRNPDRALAYLRYLRRNGGVSHPVTIYLRGGVYRLPNGFEVAGEDSGEPGQPMTIRNFPGETPYLRGSNAIDNWHPLSDPIATGLIPFAAQSHVFESDLTELGVGDLGAFANRGVPNLFRDGVAALYDKQRPLPLAGYPDAGKGWLHTTAQGADYVEEPSLAARVTAWGGFLPDGMVQGYLGSNSSDCTLMIASANPATGRINFTGSSHYGYMPNARFRVKNILAELDAPGEYFIDRARKKLFYYPINKVAPMEAELATSPRTVLRVIQVHDVKFQGLVLEQAWRNGIEVPTATNVEFYGCTMRNMGGMGAYTRIPGMKFQSCDVYNVGTVGLYVIGGDRPTLTSGHCEVDNCHIFNFAQTDLTHSPGIKIEGVGAKVTRSSIHDCQHSGLYVEGNEHLVEGNDFWNLLTATTDAGAVLLNRDWTQCGNVIRHNRFRNIYDHYRNAINSRRSDTWCIFLDDCLSGTLIEDNIFINVGAAFQLGGGRKNVFAHNVIYNQNYKNPYAESFIPTGWSGDSRLLTPESYPGLWENLNARLVAMPYQNATWAAHYQWLPNILNDEPRVAKYNQVKNNVYVGPLRTDLQIGLRGWFNLNLEADIYNFGVLNNVVGTTNQGLRNPQAGDFSVVPGSLAARQGFHGISSANIGLYNDQFRKGQFVHQRP